MASPRKGLNINKHWKWLLFILVCLIIMIGFVASPISTGDDWETFSGASRRVLQGESPYKSVITFAYFSNAPWVAILFTPVSLLPLRWGWALVCVANMVALLALAHSWRYSTAKTVLALTSPAMIYIFLHGQIDTLIIAGVLLPYSWWGLVALAKPQVAFGIIFGIPYRYWLLVISVTGSVLLITFLIFGFWPLVLLQQPKPFIEGTHNLWLGLWPFQVPVGIAAVLLGISRKDEKLLVAGSPFLFPYATTSSLIGPWLAINSLFKDWQVLIIWFSWWGAVLYRLIGG